MHCENRCKDTFFFNRQEKNIIFAILKNHAMNNEDLKRFFEDRLIEILHKETVDSYRQRCHNAYTSLIELRDVVERWKEFKVKTFDTVRILGEECVDLLKTDDCLVFDVFSKDLLLQEIGVLLKSTEKHPNNKIDSRVLFCLNQCIDRNRNCYLKNLILNLKAIIFQDNEIPDDQTITTLERIDKYLSAICVQLVFEGYTKQALYTLLKSRSKDGFAAFFKQFENIAKLNNRDYIIIWKVLIIGCEGVNLEQLGLKSLVEDNRAINDFVKSKFKKYLANSEEQYHYYTNCIKAKDKYSALKISRDQMLTMIDNLHLGYNINTIKMPENALVLEKQGYKYWATMEPTNYIMDGVPKNDYQLSIVLSEKINKLYEIKNIENGVKERLKSAIRHLNYGDQDTELEQRFINYWIALEFIFSSPQTDDNTFTRLKTNLVNVLACSYMKRNMDYLKSKLVTDGHIDLQYDIWESETSLDAIADDPTLPLIWKYKLKKMKSRLLDHTDKRKLYYINHIHNLERHITRIYNLRNVLIHEAGIKQDIENITSNLRYYLVFLLDQMVAFFSDFNSENNSKLISIEDFFNTYLNYRKMIEVNYDLSIIKSIPIAKNLW